MLDRFCNKNCTGCISLMIYYMLEKTGVLIKTDLDAFNTTIGRKKNILECFYKFYKTLM